MNANMLKNRVYLAVASALAAGAAHAAEQPFFTITEVSTNENEYMYKLADETDDYLSLVQNYDWWTYNDSIPTEHDLSNRYAVSVRCFFDGDVCSAFYDSDNVDDQASHSVYKAIVNNTSHMSSKLNGAEEQDMHTGIRRSLSDDGTIASGYIQTLDRKYSKTIPENGEEAGVRFAAVWIDGTPLKLSNYGFGQADSLLKLEDGTVLVGGGYSDTAFTTDEYFYYCYKNFDKYQFSPNIGGNCPGFSVQPALWAVDTSTKTVKDKTSLQHYTDSDKHDSMRTGDVKKIIKHGDTYYAFGLSATDDVAYERDSSNIATYWTFKFDESAGKFTDVSKFILPNIDRPGKGDEHFGISWYADANDNGIAIGNVRYSTLKNRTYPIEMFVHRIEDGSVKFETMNMPFYGANNRGVAINNNNIIVGVGDNRDSQESVANGSPRMTDGFIYTLSDKRFVSLNDLICSSSTCEQNGKYYYIYNVGDINDNNVIIANAYVYDTKEDWSKYQNARNVSIALTSDKFLGDGESIDESYIVSYTRPEITYGEDGGSSGGGSVTPFALLIMASSAAFIRRRAKKILG